MNELLQASAAAIANWLEAKLPTLGANWWVAHVVERLAFHQQRLVETNQIRSLSRLDLAALLRVLDQNWSEIAGVEALPREGRSWVKELQSVRNRWAHAPVGGVSPSDAYRDADTLARLLAALKGSDDLLKRIEEFKSKTLREIALSQSAGAESLNERAEASEVAPEVRQGAPGSKFTVGQIVCLRSNPAAVFPVSVDVKLVVAFNDMVMRPGGGCRC